VDDTLITTGLYTKGSQHTVAVLQNKLLQATSPPIKGKEFLTRGTNSLRLVKSQITRKPNNLDCVTSHYSHNRYAFTFWTQTGRLLLHFNFITARSHTFKVQGVAEQNNAPYAVTRTAMPSAVQLSLVPYWHWPLVLFITDGSKIGQWAHLLLTL